MKPVIDGVMRAAVGQEILDQMYYVDNVRYGADGEKIWYVLKRGLLILGLIPLPFAVQNSLKIDSDKFSEIRVFSFKEEKYPFNQVDSTHDPLF